MLFKPLYEIEREETLPNSIYEYYPYTKLYEDTSNKRKL
jgi:hypothetical protein